MKYTRKINVNCLLSLTQDPIQSLFRYILVTATSQDASGRRGRGNCIYSLVGCDNAQSWSKFHCLIHPLQRLAPHMHESAVGDIFCFCFPVLSAISSAALGS